MAAYDHVGNAEGLLVVSMLSVKSDRREVHYSQIYTLSCWPEFIRSLQLAALELRNRRGPLHRSNLSSGQNS